MNKRHSFNFVREQPTWAVTIVAVVAEVIWLKRYLPEPSDFTLAALWTVVTLAVVISVTTIVRDVLHWIAPEILWRWLLTFGVSAWAGVLIFFTGFALGPEIAGISMLGPSGILPPSTALLTLAAVSFCSSVLLILLLRGHEVRCRATGTVIAVLAIFVLRDLVGTSSRQLALAFTACVICWCLLVGFLNEPKAQIRSRRWLSVALLIVMSAASVLLPAHIRLALKERLLFSQPLMVSLWEPELPTIDCEPGRSGDSAKLRLSLGQTSGVVLVVVDTLRYDRVAQETMPNVTRFVDDADIVFERAYTPSPSTDASFDSMFQLDEAVSRFDELHDHGVRMESIPAHPGVANLMPEWVAVDRSALGDKDFRFALTSETVTATALERLDELEAAGDPFLLVVHYYDPHEYYVPNEHFDFGSSRAARYDAEVAYTDMAMGPLLDRATDGQTAFILTSDHGEELWDHGYVSHSNALYDESTRVLIATQSKDSAPASVSFAVSNAVVGDLLLALYTGNEVELRQQPVYLQRGSRRGIVANGWKLLWDLDSKVVELYDLERDPAEYNNLYGHVSPPDFACLID